MHKRYGFTAVELAVAIVVMGVLLSIGIVSFRSMQVTARDKERESDVLSIATYLESIYPQEILSGITVVKRAGSYPSRDTLNNSTYYAAIFGELQNKATYAPEVALTAARSFIPSTNTTGTTSVAPAPTTTTYVYAPTSSQANTSCTSYTQECRSFQIHYKLESGETKILESKRR